ncbi:hypothetical protein JR316_0005849 [Psilocybe cubensis]|uniref:Uncharacterized protein n=2 Tax=Psilocybe cubensis TaxID=181762 RepID=A0ACB8H0W8_PSICU|nr:hypothetical protein JR316_0005849 [Psilocybe cubensis]KAH9481327.1 hypothetical protein JR316_0005849 [Psilocybe cubensis]
MVSLIDRFPLEITELIVESLAPPRYIPYTDSDDEDSENEPEDAIAQYKGLKALALTCHTLLHICRKHLFFSVGLHSDKEFTRFVQIIARSPALAQFIRCLYYWPKASVSALPSLVEALQSLTQLKYLTLNGGDLLSIPNSLRDAILHLTHLPTIEYLGLSDVENIIPHLLVSCSNVKHLLVSSRGFSRFLGDDLPTIITKPTQPRTIFIDDFGSEVLLSMLKARDSRGTSMMNFDNLRRCTVFTFNEEPSHLRSELYGLISYVTCLEDLEVCGSPESLVSDALYAIASNTKALKILKVEARIRDDPLTAICAALGNIAGRNPIETLTVEIIDCDHIVCCNNVALDGGYKLLENVLLQPGWKHLQYFKLRFTIWPRTTDRHGSSNLPRSMKQELASRIKGQIEPNFQRLATKKSFKFEYRIRDYQRYLW